MRKFDSSQNGEFRAHSAGQSKPTENLEVLFAKCVSCTCCVNQLEQSTSQHNGTASFEIAFTHLRGKWITLTSNLCNIFLKSKAAETCLKTNMQLSHSVLIESNLRLE